MFSRLASTLACKRLVAGDMSMCRYVAIVYMAQPGQQPHGKVAGNLGMLLATCPPLLAIDNLVSSKCQIGAWAEEIQWCCIKADTGSTGMSNKDERLASASCASVHLAIALTAEALQPHGVHASCLARTNLFWKEARPGSCGPSIKNNRDVPPVLAWNSELRST